MHAADASLIDTLRLSDRDRRKLIDRINQQSNAPVPNERRALRVPYNVGEIRMQIRHPEGEPITYAVAPRNLSAKGMAFVHGSFLYPGSATVATLPRLHDEPVAVTGHIWRCSHLHGLLHEVTVLFDYPIDLPEFVSLTQEQAKKNRRDSGTDDVSLVAVAFMLPEGPVRCCVQPRLINSRGMALHHGRPFDADTICQVRLTRSDGSRLRSQGRVVGTTLSADSVYGISISFDREVPLQVLEDEEAHEEAPPVWPQRMLVLDPCPVDRRLVQVRLQQVGVEVLAPEQVESFGDAMASGPVDAVLVEVLPESDEGFSRIERLRRMGFSGPIVATSADDRPVIQAASLRCGGNAFIAKPIDVPRLVAAVEHLLTDASQSGSGGANLGPILSCFATDADLAPLLEGFVRSVGEHVVVMRKALAEGDLKQIQRTCRKLKGSGAAHGYESVSRFAQAALEVIDTQDQLDRARAAIDDLMSVLQRVQA